MAEAVTWLTANWLTVLATLGALVGTGTDSIIPRGIAVHRPTRKRG